MQAATVTTTTTTTTTTHKHTQRKTTSHMMAKIPPSASSPFPKGEKGTLISHICPSHLRLPPSRAVPALALTFAIWACALVTTSSLASAERSSRDRTTVAKDLLLPPPPPKSISSSLSDKDPKIMHQSSLENSPKGAKVPFINDKGYQRLMQHASSDDYSSYSDNDNFWDLTFAWRRRRRKKWRQQQGINYDEYADTRVATRVTEADADHELIQDGRHPSPRLAASPLAQQRAASIISISTLTGFRMRVRPILKSEATITTLTAPSHSEDDQVQQPNSRLQLTQRQQEYIESAIPYPQSKTRFSSSSQSVQPRSFFLPVKEGVESMLASMVFAYTFLLYDEQAMPQMGYNLLLGFLVCLISSVVLLSPPSFQLRKRRGGKRQSRDEEEDASSSGGVPSTIHISSSESHDGTDGETTGGVKDGIGSSASTSSPDTRSIETFSRSSTCSADECYACHGQQLYQHQRQQLHQEYNHLTFFSKQSPFAPSNNHINKCINAARGAQVVLVMTRAAKDGVLFTLNYVLNRYICLALIYLLVWTHVGWTVQLKYMKIRRSIETESTNTTPGAASLKFADAETVLWLNTILQQIWRVPIKVSRRQNLLESFHELSYPDFVVRAVLDGIHQNEKCSSSIASKCLPYGGLEPFLSSKIGLSLLDNFEKSKKSMPVGVSLLSLHSLTLGSRPPYIRKVVIHNAASGPRHTVGFDLDIDMSFGDSSLVLGIDFPLQRRSSLPQAQLAILADDFQLPLRLLFSMSSAFPFLEQVEISLRDMPDIQIKLLPQISNRGSSPKIDIGSFPLLREWLRFVSRKALAHAVEPNRVTMDLKSDLSHHYQLLEHRTAPYSHLTRTREVVLETSSSSRPPIDPATTRGRSSLLHQRSGMRLNAQIDQHRRTTTAAARIDKSEKTLLRPKTQLSRIALERWQERATFPRQPDDDERQKLLLRPKTHLSKIALERWREKEMAGR